MEVKNQVWYDVKGDDKPYVFYTDDIRNGQVNYAIMGVRSFLPMFMSVEEMNRIVVKQHGNKE